MKTLDEVIKKIEAAWVCPSSDEADEYCELIEIREDALQYLKTYRENQQTYIENSRKAEEARERYLEAVKNCELAENKYRKLYEETSQNLRNTSQITCPKCHSEFVILPEANNALTWDELRQMEGKPVWFEGYAGKFWCIIREVQRNMDGTEDIVLDGPSGMTGVGHDDLYGTRWQAYRKERS